MPYLRPVGLYCCFLPRLFLSPHLKSRKVYGQTNKPVVWVLFVCANYWLFHLLIFCTLVLFFCHVLLYWKYFVKEPSLLLPGFSPSHSDFWSGLWASAHWGLEDTLPARPHPPWPQLTLSLGCCSLLTWRRQWHPTPVLLPGKSHGRRNLVGYRPWGWKELDMTERLHFHFSLSCIGEGNGSPLQCSCLENPRDRGAVVYGVTQSQTQLKRLSSSSSLLMNSSVGLTAETIIHLWQEVAKRCWAAQSAHACKGLKYFNEWNLSKARTLSSLCNIEFQSVQLMLAWSPRHPLPLAVTPTVRCDLRDGEWVLSISSAWPSALGLHLGLQEDA